MSRKMWKNLLSFSMYKTAYAALGQGRFLNAPAFTHNTYGRNIKAKAAICRKEEVMNEVLQVGIITSTHGVRGEVKVFPTTDDTKRFKHLKKVLLDTGKGMLPLQLENVKFFKNMVILKFEGLDNVDDVVKYRQKSLYVERKDAVKLHKDEYFIADLIDIEVFTEEGTLLGRLTDVITTGANDVYAVRSGSAGENAGREILIPAIRQCILDVDINEKKMTVHLLEGLLDI